MADKFKYLGGLVLNSTHISEGGGSVHNDSKSLVEISAITLTDDVV